MNSYNLIYFCLIIVKFWSFSSALYFVLAAPKNDEIWNMSQETLAEQSRFTSEKSPVFITTVEFPESWESPGRGRLPLAMVVVPDEKYIAEHTDEYIKQINDEIVNFNINDVDIETVSRPVELVAALLLNHTAKQRILRIPEYLESAAKLMMVLEMVEDIEFYMGHINDAITFSKWLNNRRMTSRNDELEFNFHALNLLRGTLFKSMGLDAKASAATNVAKRIALIQNIVYPNDKFGGLLDNKTGGEIHKMIKQKLRRAFEKLTDAQLLLVAKREDSIFEPIQQSSKEKEPKKPTAAGTVEKVYAPTDVLSPNPNNRGIHYDGRKAFKCRYGRNCKKSYCPYEHENILRN